MSTVQENCISREDFTRNRCAFVDLLDDIESFLDEVISHGLLTEEHRSEIMTLNNPDEQRRCLYNFIRYKLPSGSDKLLLSLRKLNLTRLLILFDYESVYPMKFKPHGRVILINNVKFDDEKKYERRYGSENDVNRIMELFTALNFAVELYSNKTAEEMKMIIDKASSKSTKCEDCFIIFLISYGALGNIIGTDGKKLSYSTINGILRDSSQLKDKPKLIYIDACGTTLDGEIAEEFFNVPHLFVTFANVAGKQAYGNDVQGSIFVKSLVSVYEENKEGRDIFSLSRLINEQVSKESNEISEEQIPGWYSTLQKKVILQATD